MSRVVENTVGWQFCDEAFSRVKRCGNVTEVTTFDVKPKPPSIIRIDKDLYLDEKTGEIRTFVHHDTRAGNIREVKRSFGKMRDMINANVLDGRQIRLFTFTYRENMQDVKNVYSDFVIFWKRWKRYLKAHDLEQCEYIAVPEPQLRGAWHLHVIMIWPRVAPKFIKFADVSALWGHGWVDQRLGDGYKSCDNLGAYLTSYFENVPVDDLESAGFDLSEVEIIDKTYYVDGEQVTKKFAKGLRFGLYPVGMQIFRYSKGCKKPIIEDTCKAHVKEKAGAATPTFSKFWDVLNDEEIIVNRIGKTWYNAKRTNAEK